MMQPQEMSLNIWWHLPKEVWDKIPNLYKQLEGWKGFGEGGENGELGIPYWFGFNENEKYISASVEPSGLCFYGLMETIEWNNWVTQIKKTATEFLGFKVGEIEKGEVGYGLEKN